MKTVNSVAHKDRLCINTDTLFFIDWLGSCSIYGSAMYWFYGITTNAFFYGNKVHTVTMTYWFVTERCMAS